MQNNQMMTDHHEYPNPYFDENGADHLYHLGLSTDNTNFKKEFGDIKFVCMGGSQSRMTDFAKDLARAAEIDPNLPNLAHSGARFVLYKVNRVLIADHGMGVPSLLILLHEMTKLVWHAGCKDVIFVRLGSSGGFGVKPGTVVITEEALNTRFEPYQELCILGQTIRRRAQVDGHLIDDIFRAAQHLPFGVDVIKGKTLCANDFYEEQARLDGAICSITKQQKMSYLAEAKQHGVANMEMECTAFTAHCNAVGIRSAILCVTFVDRLVDDQVLLTKDQYEMFSKRPGQLMIQYLNQQGAL